MVLVGSGNLKELRKSAFKVEIQQIQEHPQFPGRNDVSKNVIGVRNNAHPLLNKSGEIAHHLRVQEVCDLLSWS